jgi:hypothetical protein
MDYRTHDASSVKEAHSTLPSKKTLGAHQASNSLSRKCGPGPTPACRRAHQASNGCACKHDDTMSFNLAHNAHGVHAVSNAQHAVTACTARTVCNAP